MNGLVKALLRYWTQKSAKYLKALQRPEAAQFLFSLAFPRKAVQGKGEIAEEYAAGAGYADLVVRYLDKTYYLTMTNKGDKARQDLSLKRFIRSMIDLKVPEGWLLAFDQDPEKTRLEKLFWECKTISQEIGLWATENPTIQLTMRLVSF
ncbi:MAG: hypothetical protein LBS60_01705 [Deltaproteobacteria bacterium]|jgi:hypothetical protein|nr:hypothetical protein [Deltaproteobacteria bacterium]